MRNKPAIKKLYQLLFFLFTISPVNISNQIVHAQQWTVTTEENGTYEVHRNPAVGNCYKQLQEVPMQFKVINTPASQYIWAPWKENDPRFREFCAYIKPHEVKCTATSSIKEPVIDNGTLPASDIRNKYFYQNEYIQDVYFCEGSSLTYGGPATGGKWQSFNDCRNINNNAIAGESIYNTIVGYFNSVDECKLKVADSYPRITFASEQTDGDCKFPNRQGLILNPGLLNDPEYNYCNCSIKDNSAKGKPSEIYYFDGSKKEVFWSGITSIDVNAKPFSRDDAEGMRLATSSCFSRYPSIKYYNSATGGCYDDLTLCKSIKCEQNQKDYLQYQGTFWNPREATTNLKETVDRCVRGGKTRETCLNEISAEALRCTCSTGFNPDYDPFDCARDPNQDKCKERCKWAGIDLSQPEPVKIQSPLALINVISNFIFWAAVILFIINFMIAGFSYIRSAGEPDKLKKAQDSLSGTIFGFVFILVASGVINYIIQTLETIITNR